MSDLVIREARMIRMLSMFVLAISIVLTSRAEASPAISGDKLIAQYKGENPYPAPNAEVGKALSIEFASGYMSGIADSYEGKHWCNKHGILPGEIKAYVQSYIEKLPDKKRSAEAKTLILEALKKRYPCN